MYLLRETCIHESLIFHELHLATQILGKRNLTLVQLSCPPSWTMGFPFIFSLIIGTKLTSSASSLQPHSLHCVSLSSYFWCHMCLLQFAFAFPRQLYFYPLPSLYVPSKANLLIIPPALSWSSFSSSFLNGSRHLIYLHRADPACFLAYSFEMLIEQPVYGRQNTEVDRVSCKLKSKESGNTERLGLIQ